MDKYIIVLIDKSNLSISYLGLNDLLVSDINDANLYADEFVALDALYAYNDVVGVLGGGRDSADSAFLHIAYLAPVDLQVTITYEVSEGGY